MALTTEQLATLAAELRTDPQSVGYASLLADQEYTAIAALLNDRPLVDNPDAQPTIAARITWDDFLDTLEPEDVLVVYAYGSLPDDIQAALSANNRTLLGAYWRGLKTALTAASVSAVQAKLQDTEPDPDWEAQIPGDSRAAVLGLPRVTGADVQRVDLEAIGA